MFARRADLNYYTARRLGDMAESLGKLAKAFDEGNTAGGQAYERGWTCRCAGIGGPGMRGLCPLQHLRGQRTGGTAIICIIFFAHLNRMAGVEEDDMPQAFQEECLRKGA